MDINLSAFRAISTGTHNVGDVRLDQKNTGLEKVNNHVSFQSRNTVVLSVEQNIAVRQAFFKALSSDGRMTSELREAFQREILGDNAVRSLTRNEIAECLHALDRGSAASLGTRLERLRSRDVLPAGTQILEVTSDKAVAMLKSVNEQMDEFHGLCQKARLQLVRLQQGHGCDEAGLAEVASTLRQLVREATGDQVAAAEVGRETGKLLADLAAGRALTKDSVVALINKVVALLPATAGAKAQEAAKVLTTNDRRSLSPTVLAQIDSAKPVQPPKPQGPNVKTAFGKNMRIDITGDFRNAVQQSISKLTHPGADENATREVRKLFLGDTTRGFHTTFAGQTFTFGTQEADEQSMAQIDAWFAQDVQHGAMAKNAVLHLCSQYLTGAFNEVDKPSFPFACSLDKHVHDFAVTRDEQGGYHVAVHVQAKVSMLAEREGNLRPLSESGQQASSFDLQMDVGVTFDPEGNPVFTIADGGSLNIVTPTYTADHLALQFPEDADQFAEDAALIEKRTAEALQTATPEEMAGYVLDDLVNLQPYDAAGRNELISLAGAYKRVLESRINTAANNEVKARFTDLAALVDKRLGELRSLNATNPLSFANVLKSVRQWNLAADVAFRLFCQHANLPPSRELMAELFIDMPSFDGEKDMNADCPDAEKYLKGLSGKTAERLLQVLRLQGIDRISDGRAEAPLDKDFVKTVLTDVWRHILNKEPWNAIEKEMVFTVNGAAKTGKSSIAPAKQIPGFAANHTYPDGVNGYMCHSFDTEHAVNLAGSSFSVNGQKVFGGVRHGVNAAVGIKNKSNRTEANHTRAKEIVTAAVLTNDTVLDQIAHLPQGSNGPVEILITSTSLLTPDAFRGGKDGEREMLREQTEAWNYINQRFGQGSGDSLTVRVPDGNGGMREVQVKPKVVAFNFGVNWGALRWYSPVTGGWGKSDEINDIGLRDLRTVVESRLAALGRQLLQAEGPAEAALAKKVAAIRKLMDQIETIYRDKSYQKDGNDAYKMVARINVLSYLLGGTPAWNCKSGKDRTGQLDVESKFLATLIELHGADGIPAPGADLTDEQRSLFQKLTLEGGNHEMQVHNTGLAGFKVKDLDSVVNRLGGEEYKNAHGGASGYVKV